MKLRDLGNFCLQDLRARRTIATTFVMIVTVMAFCTASVVTWGIAFGSLELERRRLEHDLWTQCLRVGDYQRVVIRPTDVVRIDGELKSRLAYPEVYAGVSAFRICFDRLTAWRVAGTDKEFRRLNGRTADISARGSDLFLRGRGVRESGRGTEVGEVRGVWLSPTAMETLGWDEKSPRLPTLEVRTKSGDTHSVPVVGIFSSALPEGFDYVIPEAYESELLGSKLVTAIETGSVPKSWSDYWNRNKAVDKQLVDAVAELEIAIATRTTGTRFYLKPKDGSPHKLQWYRDRFVPVQRHLEIQTQNAVPTLLEEWKPKYEPAEAPIFHFAHVYLRDLDGLDAAANVCDEVVRANGKPTTSKDLKERMQSLNARQKQTMWVVLLMQSALVFVSGLSLVSIQILRFNAKTSEAGMLRAIGMGRALLFGIVVFQAFLVSACGATVGALIGRLVGTVLATEGSTTPTQQVAFFDPASLYAMICSLCIVISMLAAVIATAHWYRRSPAELMGRG